MPNFYRIPELTRPRGPISRSKLYADAAAGLVELRKIGGMTVVPEASWRAYLEGAPVTHRAARAA